MALVLGLSGAGLGGCEGGTSSETVGVGPNEVEATLEADSITGRTGKENAVSIYAMDFQPQSDSGFSQAIGLDSLGHFLVPDLPPGHYRLLVRNHLTGKAAFLDSLTLPAPVLITRKEILQATGTLSGVLTGPPTVDPKADSLPAQSGSIGMVYAPGTPFSTLTDSLGQYALTGLPAGRYRFIKAWKPNCLPTRVCGEIPSPSDSTELEIRPGQNASW